MRSRQFVIAVLLALVVVMVIVGMVSTKEEGTKLPDGTYHVICTAPGMETVDVITTGAAPELIWMRYGAIRKDTWVLGVKDGFPIYITDSETLNCKIDQIG